ncbi:MAG: transporter [Chitinophagaceae bacterium]|nr:transporter [Chitinophagaceae bacterium]
MKIAGNKKWLWITGLALLPFAGMAQDELHKDVHQFSIQQAVDYAKKNNVQVKNALLDVQMQEQTNREVTGSAYPQISASGSLVYNAKLPVSLIPAEFFGGTPGTFEELAFGVKWGATGGVSISQILFDGQVFVGLKARTTLIKFQEKNTEITEEAIKANIYKVYYQLVVSKTQIDLLDANMELLNKLQHDTKVMYDNGFAEKLDIDKLTVQIANLQTEKTNVLNQISNGYLGLKVLMGMPVKESLVLTDTLNDQQIKDGLLDAANFDYTQRKEYQYADLGIKLAEFNVRRYKLSKIPTLSLNGYYNKNAQRNSFDFTGKGDWFGISAFTLNLNIPIFSGFSANARIAKARLSLRQSVNQQEALKLNIDNEIQTAQNNYGSAIASLDYQKKNMELAENVYQQTKKKYEIGTGMQTEITQAQTNLKTAQTNYINSLYNAIIARVDFLKATGKL